MNSEVRRTMNIEHSHFQAEVSYKTSKIEADPQKFTNI